MLSDTISPNVNRFTGHNDVNAVLGLRRTLESVRVDFFAAFHTASEQGSILPLAVLSRGNTEADIRRTFVSEGYVKGIMGLRADLVYGTGIAARMRRAIPGRATVCRSLFIVCTALWLSTFVGCGGSTPAANTVPGSAQHQRNAVVYWGSPPASQSFLGLPGWGSGHNYYGLTGIKGRSDWVEASCGDSTGVLYAYRNNGGDIASASVPLSGACAAGSTVTDGAGSWVNQGPASFPITSVQIDGSNQITLTTNATISGSNPVAVDDQIMVGPLTGAAFLSGVPVTITGFTANTLTGTPPIDFTHAAYGPAADSGTARDGTNYNNWVTDDMFLHVLQNFSGFDLKTAWSHYDSGTTGPSFGSTPFSALDTELNSYFKDPGWTTGITPKVINLSIGAENNPSRLITVNSATPQYVAYPPYGNAIKNNWASGATYFYHQYICDDGVCSGTGHWQQFVGTGANAVYTTSGSAPSWNHSGGTSTDGACANCWQDFGTNNAPQQEFTTCTGYPGDAAMTALGNGVWTLASAQAINPAIVPADLVSTWAVPWETPYMTAVMAMNDTFMTHYGVSPWGPSKLVDLQMGETAGGQSLPICGATLQAASFANTGTGKDWIALWTGMVEAYYAHRVDKATVLGLPPWFIRVSPHSSGNPSAPVDPTALSDAEADYAFAHQLSTDYAGLTGSDAATCGGGGHGNADWCRNASADCTSLASNCYTEMIGFGNCDGTGSGRFDAAINYAHTYNILTFGVYPQDAFTTDPNGIFYSANGGCGPAYALAVSQFIGVSGQ
jgi:hypothetical protein